MTHSDKGEDVVHVRADVNLHKTHDHSHLLEEELQERNSAAGLADEIPMAVGLWRRAYLTNAGIADADDVEERGHDLRQELNALEPQRLENEGDRLDHHGVMVGEGGISQDAHQRHDGHRRVELIQGQVAHVHQHLTGAVVRWREKVGCVRTETNTTAVRKVMNTLCKERVAFHCCLLGKPQKH